MLTFNDLITTTDLEFTDISSEEWRAYSYLSGEDIVGLRINKPLALHVSKSGGHRVIDDRGICYYISPKWVSIIWKPKEGQPHFVK
jgi:hypothetical protein